jgi:hypothetical protein
VEALEHPGTTAKHPWDLGGRANMNLRRENLISQLLASVQHEKNRLRADLYNEAGKVEHDETLCRLKAANQRESKLRDAALGQKLPPGRSHILD